MRVAFFDTHRYDRETFNAANESFGHDLAYLDPRLGPQTAILARGYGAVCAFVNDRLDEATLEQLADEGVQLVALRSAGYNNVDLAAAERLGLPVVRVPEYSPHAVAEHAVALVLALDRKLVRAQFRVHDWNFSLEGLVGFDLHGKTVAIVGTGKIGRAAARIFLGFGCRVLAFDRLRDAELEALGVRYVSRAELMAEADIISLHVPLTPETYHLVDAEAFREMKRGVMLINTSRGALIDSRALIEALKRGDVGSAGLDVYEEEEGVFFEDVSDRVPQDDVLARLLSFPNVLVTSHQAFLTREALAKIAEVTLGSISAFEEGEELRYEVRAEAVRARPTSTPPPAAATPR